MAGLKKDFIIDNNIVQIKSFESLSPSELEEYYKCPFKLLAQKVFKLKDLPQVAVDLDPRQKGSILHYLFEFLIQNLDQLKQAELQVGLMQTFLDQKRTELKIYPYDDLLWSIQKAKLIQVGQQFTHFELSRKSNLNKATELSFELIYDFDKKTFSNSDQASQNYIKFKGRIDRLDESSDGLIIYDYKSSTTDLSHFSDWVEQGEFQLLIYMLACEEALFKPKKVIASVYYDYRKYDYSKGFMLSEFHDKFIETLRKKKSLASSDQKVELFQQFSEALDIIVKKLQQFDFSAAPNDVKICSSCNWSQLCRAQHLM